MSLVEFLSTNEGKKVHSEEILNVLRESNDLVLGTNDIAEGVGMSGNGVRSRLEQLEDETRVIAQEIGTKKGHTLVWGLHPDERQEPINPDIDRLVKWCDIVSVYGRSIILTGALAVAVGVVLWFGSMTMGLLGDGTSDLYIQIHALGYSIAAGGGLALAAGAAVKLLPMVGVKVADKLV